MPTWTNARLFDGNRMLPGLHSVTVEGDLITAVDSADPGADAIDLDGKLLMPGLICGHFHPDFFRFTLADALAGNQLGKEMPPGVLTIMGVRNCRMLIDSGFTGYIGAGCAADIDASLKLAIADGIIRGPRIRAAGHHINTTGSVNEVRKWWQRFREPGIDIYADGPEALRAVVREEIRRGVETVKIIGSPGHGAPAPRMKRNIARDELDAIVGAAHDRGALVRAHVCERDHILEFIEAGVDIIDHGDGVDEHCVEAMVKAGSYWVPSLTFSSMVAALGFDADGEFDRSLSAMRRLLPLADAAGVKIMTGDDYSGFLRDVCEDDPLDHELGCYGREIEFYSDFDGISTEMVLRWATANPGRLLDDLGAPVGVVAEGAKADLIVIDGDALADPRLFARPEQHLKLVMVGGEALVDRLAS